MLIPLVLAGAVSTADYACWMEDSRGQVVNMTYLCQDAEATDASTPASTDEAPATAPSATPYLLQQTGALDSSDAMAPDGSFYDSHVFQGEANQTVTITLESDAFDTYLLLLDANGQILAQNDDATGMFTNSQIVTRLPATANYQVIVNSFWPGSEGPYRLTVQAGLSANTGQTSLFP